MAPLEDNEAPTLTFQTWYSTSEDMVVTIRRNITEDSSKATLDVVIRYLDGLEMEQLESAISGADQIETHSPDEVIGIVIDKRGDTEDFDWDAFVCAPTSTPPVPDRLVVRREGVERHAVDQRAWSMDDPTPALATLIDVRNDRDQ